MTAWRPQADIFQERSDCAAARKPPNILSRQLLNGQPSRVPGQSVICGDLDCRLQGPVDRAIPGVHRVHPLDRFLLLGIGLNPVADVDPPDNEDPVFGLDFTSDFRCELTVAGVNLTRFQRASECTRESPARGRNHIIQGGRPLVEVIRSHPVVPSHVAVHPESDGLVFRGQIGKPNWTLQPLDFDS